MRKHASDLISLIFGVILAASGALLVLVDSPPDDFPAYAGPALLGILGLLLLAVGASRSSARPVVSRDPQTAADDVDDPPEM